MERPEYHFTPSTNFHRRRENKDNIVGYFTSIQSGIKVPVSQLDKLDGCFKSFHPSEKTR